MVEPDQRLTWPRTIGIGMQHVIAMFGPSFFTGHLISRFGARRISILGLILTAIAAVVSLDGVDVAHFWVMLIILGVGWNFGFLGASALILQCHRPEEKNRVQSLNDFIVFSLMALGSFASGGILSTWGWDIVLWVSFAPVIVAAVILLVVANRNSLSGQSI